MSVEVDKNQNVSEKNKNPNLPKPQDEQLQEGTLLLMEEALEERGKKTRRLADSKESIPTSEDRRKAQRRNSDKIDQG